MRRSLALVGVVCAAAAALAGLHAGSARPVAARRAAPPLDVVTRLPPGGPRAYPSPSGSSQATSAPFSAQTAATSRRLRPAGSAGMPCASRRRAPGATACRSVAGRSWPAGTLVVRRVELEAVGDITPGEQVGPTISPPAPPTRGRRRDAAPRRHHHCQPRNRGLDPRVPRRQAVHFGGPPRRCPPAPARRGRRADGGEQPRRDYGPDALPDTLQAAQTAGMRRSARVRRARRAAARLPPRRRPDDRFLGYSDVNPAGFLATGREPGTAPADTAAITADVRAARRKADVVVCWFHWETERHPEPDAAAGLRRSRPRRRCEAGARGAPARPRLGRPPDTPHTRRLDARELRLPLERCVPSGRRSSSSPSPHGRPRSPATGPRSHGVPPPPRRRRLTRGTATVSPCSGV